MNKIICLLLLFLSPLVFSQELNCTIDINFQQITGADPSVYEKMKKDIFDFMNNRKWTNDVYAPVEKIECNFFITISKVADDNASFSASLQVQSSRPVYGTNLKAAMLSIQDDNFNFTYSKLKKIKEYQAAQIIHLHNIHGGYFDLNDLRKIAKEKIIVWTLHDMWAITGGESYIMDDENFNGKMDYSFLGIPKEGFGFSNYYHTGLTKPKLNSFAFEVLANKNTKVEVKMKYM